MRCMILGAAFAVINMLEFPTYRTPVSAIAGRGVDSLNALKVISRAAEVRSFTDAGQQLSLPSSALGKAVARAGTPSKPEDLLNPACLPACVRAGRCDPPSRSKRSWRSKLSYRSRASGELQTDTMNR